MQYTKLNIKYAEFNFKTTHLELFISMITLKTPKNR